MNLSPDLLSCICSSRVFSTFNVCLLPLPLGFILFLILGGRTESKIHVNHLFIKIESLFFSLSRSLQVVQAVVPVGVCDANREGSAGSRDPHT